MTVHTSVPVGFTVPHGLESPYCIKLEVSWGEMDALGHVNNIIYLRWFENARFHYFERVGVRASHEAAGIGPILARSDCEYLAKVEFPDTVWVSTRVVRIGNSSFEMENRAYSEAGNCLCARGMATLVMVDYNQQGKPVRVPEDVRAGMRAFEGPQLDKTSSRG